MNLIEKIIIPIQPVTKKNHGQIVPIKGTKRHIILPSEQFRDYRTAAMYYIRMRVNPIKTAVNLRCLFYMGSKRRVDLVNLLQCVCDILVDANLLEDDNSNIVVSMDGSRVLYDKQHPRTEIEITEA